MSATLYLVATPIGNLEDMSYRAVRILGEVDLIACEDTRQTRKLLDHYGIRKPQVSYHDHNEVERSQELVAKLQAGSSVALVSDAGMPLVSDPGYRLVAAAISAGIQVVPIPGPSALVAGIAASGLASDSFWFGGFLPARSSQRVRALEEVRDQSVTLIFYEAPHRICETLADVEQILGNRRVVVARELTKIHEEFLRGTAAEVRSVLESRASIKGEITVLIGKAEALPQIDKPIAQEVQDCIAAGLSRMDAIKKVARSRGLSKREVYRQVEESRLS